MLPVAETPGAEWGSSHRGDQRTCLRWTNSHHTHPWERRSAHTPLEDGPGRARDPGKQACPCGTAQITPPRAAGSCPQALSEQQRVLTGHAAEGTP